MSKAYINPTLCDRSPMCAAKRACPQKAIIQESSSGILGFLRGGPLKVDPDKCTGCSICITRCPHHAISLK